jgi:DNA-binding SARP family transcriptional activator
MLWPKDDPETALSRLYVRISQLRKLLDSGTSFNPISSVPGGYLFVYPDPAEYVLEEEHVKEYLWVDVDAFEKAIAQRLNLVFAPDLPPERVRRAG